jgi:tetratricopeptide (TPR) repeat protein
MDTSRDSKRRSSRLDLENKASKRLKCSPSVDFPFSHKARRSTLYEEVSLELLSSIDLTEKFSTDNEPIQATTTILCHNVKLFETDVEEYMCQHQDVKSDSLLRCLYGREPVVDVNLDQRKVDSNDLPASLPPSESMKLASPSTSGSYAVCENLSSSISNTVCASETLDSSIVRISSKRPSESAGIEFYELLSLTVCQKYGCTKRYRPSALVHYVNQILKHLSLRRAASLFAREWMMSTQFMRSNSIFHATLVFKAGIKLHDAGFVHSAMNLYEEFLNRLIHINNNASQLGANNQCLENNGSKKSVLETTQEQGRKPTNGTIVQSLYEASMNTFLGIYPRMATTFKKLGSLHLQMNDYRMALHYFHAGIRVDEVLLHVCYSNIVETLMNIALIHRRSGNYTLALTKYIQVYFLQLRAYGPNSMSVATSLSMIAFMQYRLKQYSSAFELYQESLTIQRDILGENNIGVASTINSLGLCCFYLRIFNHAKTFFMHSLKVRRTLLGADHYDLAIIWYNVATICVEMKEELEAIRCYKESLRIEMIGLDYRKCDGAILTFQNLGYIYQQNGEIDEASFYFRKALELQKRKIGGGNEIIGKLYNLIGNIYLQKAEVKEMMECYIAAARSYQRGRDRNETMVISGYTFYSLSKLHPQCAQVA